MISENRRSHGTISRKDPPLEVGILRDFTPECRRYLAGLYDADGCFQKYVAELNLNIEEYDILPHIQQLVGGGNVGLKKGVNGCRYRVGKERSVLIDQIKPFIATSNKLDQLKRGYEYKPKASNRELSDGWLAGFFDGDGTHFISKEVASRNTLSINQSDRAILDQIQRKHGGNLYHTPYNTGDLAWNSQADIAKMCGLLVNKCILKHYAIIRLIERVGTR